MAFKAGSIFFDTQLKDGSFKKGLSGLKKSVLAGGAAIAAAFTAAMAVSIKKANEFQKSMSNVSTIIDTAEISTQDLTKQLLKLDPALGDAKSLTDALYQSFSSGADTADEAMKTTIDAAKFGKAALTDTATAVDVLTTAVNAYGKENMSTTEASDLFFTAIREGKLTGEQLASSIGASIPLFASTGIEMKELTAGMAAMTKQGVDANNATTQLNAIVNAFLKPSEEMSAALNEMGYASGSAFIEAEGLSGALKMIEERTKGDATEMSKLLPNIRALRGAMALTGVGGQEFNEILGEMENATGATELAFAKQEKTFETFKNQVGNLQIVVGNIGKAFVDHIAVGATKAAGGMISFLTSSRGMEIISNIAGTLAGAFSAIKTAITPIIETVGPSLKNLFGDITEAMDSVTGSTTEGAGASKLLAGASKAVASGFAIVTSIVGEAIKTIANLVNLVSKTGNLFGDFLTGILHPSKMKDVKASAGEVADSIKNLVNGVAVSIGDIVGTVKDEFANFGEETDALAQDIEISYSTAFTNTKKGIETNWAEIFTGQEDFAGNMISENEKLMAGMLGGVQDYADGTDNSLKNASISWSSHFQKLLSEGKTSYAELKRELDKALDESLISEEEYAVQSRQLWEDNWNSKIDKVQTYFDLASTIFETGFDIINGIQNNKLQAELNALEDQKENALAQLEEKFNNELISQEAYEEQKAAIEATANERINKVSLKQFENQKQAQKAGALMDAASSIMGWWAQAPKLGPIAGPIFASAMSAATLVALKVRTDEIDNQRFTPKRAGGPAHGLVRMHEDGGELTMLPNGSLVIPHDLSKNLMSNKGNNFYVSFEGANINNDMDLKHITKYVTDEIAKQLRLAR